MKYLKVNWDSRNQNTGFEHQISFQPVPGAAFQLIHSAPTPLRFSIAFGVLLFLHYSLQTSSKNLHQPSNKEQSQVIGINGKPRQLLLYLPFHSHCSGFPSTLASVDPTINSHSSTLLYWTCQGKLVCQQQEHQVHFCYQAYLFQ